MTVTLTRAAEALLEARLKSGHFASPSEVIEVALSALPEYNSDDLAALEVGIVEGLADADEGRLSTEDEARAYLNP
jgi:Arc/MetJ-type ribon-helix-helix transcriptional regulator